MESHKSFCAVLHINLIITLLFLTVSDLQAQIPDYPLPQYPDQWNASWITHPDISRIDLKYPVKDGMINMQLQFSEKGKVTGTIDFPENISGSFVWKESMIKLKPGLNNLDL